MSEEEFKVKLSDQAIEVLSLCMLKSLVEGESLQEMLSQLEFENFDEGLVVLNPPTKLVIPKQEFVEGSAD